MAQSNGNGKHSHIKGWGSDLDHHNRPAYPKERMPPRLPGIHWTQPDQQEPRVQVLHSIEHDGLTPLFGSSVPPSGLSGVVRRGAFKLSENDLRHWLLLFLADRINVVEGLMDDVRKSKRTPVIGAVSAVAAAAGVFAWLVRKKR